MKYIILTIFYLISFSSPIQKSGGIAIYDVDIKMKTIPNDVNKDSVSIENLKRIEHVLKNSKSVQFELKFNKVESIYSKIETLENENDNALNITDVLTESGINYVNLKTNERLNQKNAYGEMFLISGPINEWELCNEMKKINNFTCYKATTTKVIENKSGIKTISITAWYTPEINFSHGPLGYAGLPGLVLELEDGQLLIKASKLKFASNKINISKPIEGKKVTYEEFSKLSKEMYYKLRQKM